MAGIGGTLVNVCLTVRPCIAGLTGTGVLVDSIVTCTVIEAGIRGTFVVVLVTIQT